jgi:RNA polymerase sigma-70 factor (ECF subfamily)
LARWILRNEHDAEDAVQDAYLRAFRNFSKFRGGDGRPWLLTVVRNTCYSRLRQARGEVHDAFDETVHGLEDAPAGAADRSIAGVGSEMLREAMEALPEPMREIIVLHDVEGLAYRDIAEVTAAPLGTVMSRLSRARRRLHVELLARIERETRHES